MMKLTGFIKEHNDIPEAEYFLSLPKVNILPHQLAKATEYLSNGTLVLSWMGYFWDISNRKIISSDSYYSDGEYIWPSYYPIYLRKLNKFYGDENLLKKLVKRKGLCRPIDSKDVILIEKFLSVKLSGLNN